MSPNRLSSWTLIWFHMSRGFSSSLWLTSLVIVGNFCVAVLYQMLVLFLFCESLVRKVPFFFERENADLLVNCRPVIPHMAETRGFKFSCLANEAGMCLQSGVHTHTHPSSDIIPHIN